MFGPTGDIQFVSKASCMNFISSPPMWGVESQILSLFIWGLKIRESLSLAENWKKKLFSLLTAESGAVCSRLLLKRYSEVKVFSNGILPDIPSFIPSPLTTHPL
jgi:hypothetical protein